MKCHCSNMDGTRDYYTKWIKSDRERQYHIISYAETKKKYKNEIYKRVTDS